MRASKIARLALGFASISLVLDILIIIYLLTK